MRKILLSDSHAERQQLMVSSLSSDCSLESEDWRKGFDGEATTASSCAKLIPRRDGYWSTGFRKRLSAPMFGI
jgi:hypothetical protein